MLVLTINDETFDESSNTFCDIKATVKLEHSLKAISKWEEKNRKVFIKNVKNLSSSEFIDYIKCMNAIPNTEISDVVATYLYLNDDFLLQITHYIDEPMTALYIPEEKNKSASKDVISNEMIYYWMISFNIPMECENWHLNHLLALIHVFEVKNSNNKKMSHSELAARNRALNAKRLKKYNTRG